MVEVSHESGVNRSIEERRSAEWGALADTLRAIAIDKCRTTAMERMIGAEIRFVPGIGSVTSVSALPTALTCILAPLEGDPSMWSRMAAAVDLAFVARPALRQHLDGKDRILSIITNKITVSPSGIAVKYNEPVVLKEVATGENETDAVTQKTKGVVLFECSQGDTDIGTIVVEYRYVNTATVTKMINASGGARQDAMINKDAPLAMGVDSTNLHQAMGMEFGDRGKGFDAVCWPYPYCVNYWSTIHGSYLVAFATLGIPGIENGFEVSYKAAAIPKFPSDDPRAASTKGFYRRVVGNTIHVVDVAGNQEKVLVEIVINGQSKLPDPDLDMVARMRKRDNEAWVMCMTKYSPMVLSLVTHYLPDLDPPESARMVREFFAERIVENIDGYDLAARKMSFRTWLQSSASSFLCSRMKARNRRDVHTVVSLSDRNFDFGVLRSDPNQTDPESIAIREENRRIVRNGVASLQPIYRDAVFLVDLAGHSYQDAAELLQIPLGTLRNRVHRGRELLRIRLKEKYLPTPRSRSGR